MTLVVGISLHSWGARCCPHVDTASSWLFVNKCNVYSPRTHRTQTFIGQPDGNIVSHWKAFHHQTIWKNFTIEWPEEKRKILIISINFSVFNQISSIKVVNKSETDTHDVWLSGRRYVFRVRVCACKHFGLQVFVRAAVLTQKIFPIVTILHTVTPEVGYVSEYLALTQNKQSCHVQAVELGKKDVSLAVTQQKMKHIGLSFVFVKVAQTWACLLHWAGMAALA